MNPLLLFLLLPIAEIAMFAQVGAWIGALATVSLVLLSMVVGSVLLRRQGLSALKRAQDMAARGESPVGAVFEGFCVVVAAVLLIIPGFLTDIVGILLFVPPVRNALGRWLFERMRSSGSVRVWTSGPGMGGGMGPGQHHRPRPGVIDGDFREVDPTGNATQEDPDMPRLEESRWAPPRPRGNDDRP